MTLLSETSKKELINSAEDADRLVDWPTRSWQLLCESGALKSSIPLEFSGTGLSPLKLQHGMEQVASCCLTTAFVLSQREAAIRNLLRGPDHIKQRYLPMMAAGEAYLTVGLSQLTTSRQHLGPSVRATSLSAGGYLLNGEIPWVTGADQAAAIVAGATLPDSTQLLGVISAEKLSGMIDPPMPLAALAGSRTSLVRCQDVRIEPESVLIEPSHNVLGILGGGGLDTSCLAIGLASAAQQFIEEEAQIRPELSAIAVRYGHEVIHNREKLLELATSVAEPKQALALRTACTKLVLRVTQAALMIAKGNGFVVPHPAQRWARQATFFLVWSCPRPVAEEVLADLADW